MSICASENKNKIDDSDTEPMILPKRITALPIGITLRPVDSNGNQKVFRPAVSYRCYTLNEYQQISDLFIDYQWFYGYGITVGQKMRQYQLQVHQLVATNQVLRDNIAILDRSVEFQATALSQERALRIADDADRKKRERYLWIGGGAVLVINVILVFALIAQ